MGAIHLFANPSQTAFSRQMDTRYVQRKFLARNLGLYNVDVYRLGIILVESKRAEPVSQELQLQIWNLKAPQSLGVF